jgi:hypothetical protein
VARVKGDLRIEFGDEKLTSHAGLELLRRFVREVGFLSAIRDSAKRLRIRGDFSFGKVVLTVVGMLLVGAKRLRHLTFVGSARSFFDSSAWCVPRPPARSVVR